MRLLLPLIILNVSGTAKGNSTFTLRQDPEVTVTRGDTAKLYCIFPILPHKYVRVHWWRDGEDSYLDERLDRRIYSYFLSQGSAILQINAVTAEDAGVYFCRLIHATVSNGTGTKLMVYDPPTPLRLKVMLPKNKPVTLALICNTAAFFPQGLNITWYKNGSDIIPEVEPIKTKTTAGLYEASSCLTETEPVDDGTIYTCQVSHNALPNPANISYIFYSPDSDKYNSFDQRIYGYLGTGIILFLIVIFIVIGRGMRRMSNGRDNTRTKQSEDDQKLTYVTLNMARAKTSTIVRDSEQNTIYAQTIHGQNESQTEEINVNADYSIKT
ncbi:natural cytotoxicity triggering receptor 3 ligand 1-like isoform X1 [Mobula birostris]|uniref:natural cytotoxicity triggering receptor 3 ligand 1-like isoform X1 n=1 Tax=Mobula birostris TaxID=1983395 RepID=UPI003B27B5A4